MMQQLIITKGLPASGKTTFAINWVNEAPKERVRVNRDDIRRMLGPYWIPTRESLVTGIEENMVKYSLKLGYSVILDATNFRCDKWESSFLNHGIKPEIKDFTDISLEICIERDKLRVNSVGEEVIRGMYNKYLKI